MLKSSSTPRVLFTRELSKKRIHFFANKGIIAEGVPFISVSAKPVRQWHHKIPAYSDAWVFTSQNAVSAISPLLKDLQIPKNVFAVGEQTSEALSVLGLDAIIPDESNARKLAELISSYTPNQVVYFCGNLRKETLALTLAREKIPFQTVEVYETVLSPQAMDMDHFDAITFMSPSSATSFFEMNLLPANFPVFCIGETTGSALQNYGIRHYLTAEISTFTSLAHRIITYFNRC